MIRVLNKTEHSTVGAWQGTPSIPSSNYPGPAIINHEVDNGQSKIFTDFTRYMFEVVVYTVLCGCVSIVGIGANAINLLVFIKQGLWTDSVTATLAGLAIADLCCLITMLWLSINYAIMLSPPKGLPWDPLSVLYITGGWPHVMFTRVTCWITAYVALERCMCVMLPFKVKQLFTAFRSMIVIGSIFAIIIATYIPIFYTHRLQNVVDTSTNITEVRLVFTSSKDRIENICHYINDVILPTCSLCIVIVSTRLTISHLNLSSKWRQTNASSGYVASNRDEKTNSQEKNIDSYTLKERSEPMPKTDANVPASTTASTTTSTKETKVVRMVTLICTIFIICNSPCILIIYLRFVVPEIANMRRYHNLFHILYSIDFLLESFNSTINILVYYSMSSRYKHEFQRLFGMRNAST